MTSCTGLQDHLSKIPNREFTKFKYDRTGNFTATKIEAVNGKKTDSGIEVESAKVFTMNPLFQADIEIEGYKVSE